MHTDLKKGGERDKKGRQEIREERKEEKGEEPKNERELDECRLYIMNLPFEVTENELRNHFH